MKPEQILAHFFVFDNFHLMNEGRPARTGAGTPEG